MPHHFSLEAVLRLRQHREAAEERTLASLGAQRVQLETTLGRVRQQMRHWTEERGRDAGVLTTANAQQGSYARLLLLREAEQQLEQQREELVRRFQDQQELYLKARRDRETLAELKQGQHQLWRAEEQRNEQRRLEDQFLARWKR